MTHLIGGHNIVVWQQATKGFTSAGLTGQAILLWFFNLALVLGLTKRYSSVEFICNLLSLFSNSSMQYV